MANDLTTDFEAEGFESSDLEQRIRGAKDLVVPSDTLRGRVVGESLRRHQGERFDRRVYRLCMLLLIGSACYCMSLRSLDGWWNEHFRITTSETIERRAEEIRRIHHVSPADSTADAYSEWKNALSSQWQASPWQATFNR